MKGYELTIRGKFTVALLSLIVLIGAVSLAYNVLPESLFAPPSASPVKESGRDLQSPSKTPPNVSAEPSDTGNTESSEPSTEPVPIVTPPPPQEKPTPTLSWGSKSLTLGFDKGSSKLNRDATSALSQFFGDSPDLSGWIVVIEAFCMEEEATDTLRMDRAKAVGDYLTDRYGITSDMILPINGDENAEKSYVDIYFIGSGTK